MFFFTVVLADRSNTLLVDHVDRLRRIYQTVQQRRPFETIAIRPSERDEVEDEYDDSEFR